MVLFCGAQFMNCVMRKPAFCICENKVVDQLQSNYIADKHLCFCYIDSKIPLLPKSKISSLKPSSVVVQPTGQFVSVLLENPKARVFLFFVLQTLLTQFFEN